MSVTQKDTVDAIGIDDASGYVTLLISDHLDWKNDINSHLYALQEKINTYLRFIESGELLDVYPNAQNRKVQINVALKFLPNQDAIVFFKKVGGVLAGAGVGFCYEKVDE